jgi:hypothetical protein
MRRLLAGEICSETDLCNAKLSETQSPPSISLEGFVHEITRTVTLSPESKEGLQQPHNPTTQWLLFLFSFLLGFFLCSHKHLLLGFDGRANFGQAVKHDSGEDDVLLQPSHILYLA